MKPRLLDVVDDAVLERFWSKVEKTEACWLWRAALQPAGGYGAFCVRKPLIVGAHRFAYEITYGELAPNAVVCHHCDTPACVRPDHLFAGSHADNVADMVAKGRNARGALLNHPIQKGEHNRAAKLSDADVIEIRRRYAAGERPTRLAVEFGIKYGTLWSITSRKRWVHLP